MKVDLNVIKISNLTANKMADTQTETISLSLYRYMCQNIVGSDKHVKTMRLIHTVRDNLNSNKYRTSITSGSFGEGLELRGSDLDMMQVLKLLGVYEYGEKRLNPNKVYYRMETDDVKPGFAHLLVQNSDIRDATQIFRELNGKRYVSSTLFIRRLLPEKYGGLIHGPCISDRTGFLDHAICLHCETWISKASQWISRSNNSWPSYNVKQCIIKHGVLVVPIGVKGSPKEDIEWRISFSVGEKFLIDTFTHTQLICYALMKIILKDVIASFTECKELLCSYFLKTIIFWISEELPQSIWKPENLLHCFMRCFDRLIYSVDYSVCLHYFIPENNMFENKIEGSARDILLEKLYILHSYGWRSILFSDQFSNIHVSNWMFHIARQSLLISDVDKALNSDLFILSNSIISNYNMDERNKHKRRVHTIVSCEKSSIKNLYTYTMSLLCAQHAQCISLENTRRSNKHQYKQYKSCLCTLLQNIYHDAVSGWLMLASLFYKTKQYNNALRIIMYSISKLTPEKLYRVMDLSDFHFQLLEFHLIHRKSVVHMWKIMLVEVMNFKRNSLLIPNELQMEVANEGCTIPSIVYAYFLKLLCHYHLDNVRDRQDCLHTLQLVIAEKYLIGNYKALLSEAYNILGIALQLVGDREAAHQAFIQSVEIYPDNRYNTSVKRLSLMRTL